MQICNNNFLAENNGAETDFFCSLPHFVVGTSGITTQRDIVAFAPVLNFQDNSTFFAMFVDATSFLFGAGDKMVVRFWMLTTLT